MAYSWSPLLKRLVRVLPCEALAGVPGQQVGSPGTDLGEFGERGGLALRGWRSAGGELLSALVYRQRNALFSQPMRVVQHPAQLIVHGSEIPDIGHTAEGSQIERHALIVSA